MDTATEDWLIYNHQYKTLICRQHGYAVTCLGGHLKARHPYLDRRARQEILSRHEGLPLLLPAPSAMLKHGPDNPSEPVEGLTIHRGWACTYPFCQAKTTSWKTMRVHVNQEHNKKGKRALQEWTTPAQLQTFLAGPKYAVLYFCVQTSPAGDGARASTTEANTRGDVVASIAGLWSEQRQEQEQLRSRMDAGMPKHETSNWLNRTGWPAHLEGKELEQIYEASKKPSSGQDAVLERLVVETHELIVTRCVGGLSSMPLMIRSHLASPHNNDMDSRPFGRLQEDSSTARYVGYIQRFLCYCLTVPFCDQFDLLDAHNFRFTPKQALGLRRLEKHLEDEECPSEVVQEQILQVLASFWMQQLPGSPFDSPLWHFVSVLAIDPDTWQFRTADRFTYVLAGLMYCARATMAEYILPAAQRATMDDLHERFMAARAKWLCKGTITPMGYMLSLHLYGRKIARETGSRLRVTWSEDGQRMHYLGQPLAMEDIRNMVASMTAEAEELLWGQLMFKEGGLDARFTIPLDELQDDMTLTTRGKSFVHTNRSLVNKEVEMLEDLVRSPRADALLDRKGMFKEKGEMVYRKLVRRFEGFLLLLCHFTGGQPSRGPEILGLRLANGITRDRSVFIIDGQVVLVTQYHKSLAHFDAPKVIPRFLPARVGQLLAMYMVYIRPFVDRLEADQMDRYGQMRAPSDFIWQTEGNPWQSPQMSNIMGRETQRHLGYKITIQHWRHIAIAISKKHTRQRAGSMQADFDEGDEDEEYDLDEQYEEPDDVAAGHTSRVAEHYGVTMDIVKRLSAESLRVFKQVSHRWHVFLGCVPPRPPHRGKTERKGEETGEMAKPSRQVDVTAGEDREMDDSIRQALCRAVGDPAAEFRSEQQKRAIHCAAKGLSPLVVILPTGSGKSLVFMVPALLPDAGITIVVTPYRLLKEQLASRCREAGIHCQTWPEARTTFPRVTVVSAEAAVTDSFLQWAAELSSRGRLDRVVIDECHVVITAGETYRSKLRELVRLRDLGRPCIFMTGTLPPSRQPDLEKAMLLSTPLYIRSSSHRTTMRYSVLRAANGKDITEVLRLVRARQARMKPGEKGIVFCNNYQKCQAVSKQLHCFWYHALRDDEESHLKAQRDQGFRDWVAGSGSQYVAATGAMGTGLDFAGIVHIIHLGHPYSLIDYAQETGRGGRGGEAVDADVIITEGDWPSEDKHTDESTVPDRRYVNMFIRTEGCRRAQLGLYLDGNPQDCSRIDAIPCDNCLQAQQAWRSETPGEVYQAAKRRRQEDAAGMEHIVAALDNLADIHNLSCRVCWLLEGTADGGHSWLGCFFARECRLDFETCMAFQGQIQYSSRGHSRYLSCYRCHVSQEICTDGYSTKGKSKACERRKHIILPVALAAMREPTLKEKVIEVAGYNFPDEPDYVAWLGRKHPKNVCGRVMTNAMAVFDIAVRWREEKGIS